MRLVFSLLLSIFYMVGTFITVWGLAAIGVIVIGIANTYGADIPLTVDDGFVYWGLFWSLLVTTVVTFFAVGDR